MTSVIAAFLVTAVVFIMSSQVEAYWYFGLAGDAVSEIKSYDTLKTDITKTLNKYNKGTAAACKAKVTQQPFYKDGFKKISNKITEATKAINKVDKDGEAAAKNCPVPDTNPCVGKLTNTAQKKIKNIKGPAIKFIKDTKTSTLDSVKKYMDRCSN